MFPGVGHCLVFHTISKQNLNKDPGTRLDKLCNEYVDFCVACLLVFRQSHNSKAQWNWSGKHSNV